MISGGLAISHHSGDAGSIPGRTRRPHVTNTSVSRSLNSPKRAGSRIRQGTAAGRHHRGRRGLAFWLLPATSWFLTTHDRMVVAICQGEGDLAIPAPELWRDQRRSTMSLEDLVRINSQIISAGN